RIVIIRFRDASHAATNPYNRVNSRFPPVRFCVSNRQISVNKQKPRTTRGHHGWDLPDSAVTSEAYYLRRREFLRIFGLGLAASALGVRPLGGELDARSGPPEGGTPSHASTLNDSLNPGFKLDGIKLTPDDLVTSYNNFYEWGLAKDQPKE